MTGAPDLDGAASDLDAAIGIAFSGLLGWACWLAALVLLP